MKERDGKIVTFYSYKGGVGRSFLLANVAATLTNWGFRVLCIDWDLEAPGLDYFFAQHKISDQNRSRGLIDWVLEDEISAQTFLDNSSVIKIADQQMDFVSSGLEGPGYYKKLSEVDWNILYSEKKFGEKLEELKSLLKKEYDFILVDSRTGITDTSSICAAQLPDILCLVFTANEQNIQGSTKVIDEARIARDRLPFCQSSFKILPILSRFDKREEYDIADQWLEKIQSSIKEFYSSWVSENMYHNGVRNIINRCTIPYIAKWSFGESITVLEENVRDPERISYWFENVAGVLANNLNKTELLVESRDNYVTSGKELGSKAKAPTENFDYYLSWGENSSETALDVYLRLKRFRKKVLCGSKFTNELPKNSDDDEYFLGNYEEFPDNPIDKIGNAKSIIIIIDDESSPSQAKEVKRFLKKNVDDNFNGDIFILFNKSSEEVRKLRTKSDVVNVIPPYLIAEKYYYIDSMPGADFAMRIVRE